MSIFGARLVPKKNHIFFPELSGAKIFYVLLEKLWENIENIMKPRPYGAIYNFTTHLWSANENLKPIFEKYSNFGYQKSKIDRNHGFLFLNSSKNTYIHVQSIKSWKALKTKGTSAWLKKWQWNWVSWHVQAGLFRRAFQMAVTFDPIEILS